MKRASDTLGHQRGGSRCLGLALFARCRPVCLWSLSVVRLPSVHVVCLCCPPPTPPAPLMHVLACGVVYSSRTLRCGLIALRRCCSTGTPKAVGWKPTW